MAVFKCLFERQWVRSLQDAGVQAIPPASAPAPVVATADPAFRSASDDPPANSLPTVSPSQPSGDSEDGTSAGPVSGKSTSPSDSGPGGADAGPIVAGVVGAGLLLLAGLAALLYIHRKRRGATATGIEPPVRLVAFIHNASTGRCLHGVHPKIVPTTLCFSMVQEQSQEQCPTQCMCTMVLLCC